MTREQAMEKALKIHPTAMLARTIIRGRVYEFYVGGGSFERFQVSAGD